MPSAVISAYSYDSEARILRVTYVSGLIYEYFDVPPEVYDAMKATKAKGIFLNNIIKGNYAFKIVS